MKHIKVGDKVIIDSSTKGGWTGVVIKIEKDFPWKTDKVIVKLDQYGGHYNAVFYEHLGYKLCPAMGSAKIIKVMD